MADTPRARARAEMTEQIKQIGRRHLAAEGPNLSLRAVARDLGVVSSAVYRYFASRDELLTALIVDGYTSMADAIEAAEAAAPRRELLARWLALGNAARSWSLANRHEYGLLYGTPVPGYAAPSGHDRAGAAAGVRGDGHPARRGRARCRRGARGPAARSRSAPTASASARIPASPAFPPTLLARALSVWAQLFGTISFELFGRLTNGVTDYDTYFEHQLRVMARYLGLVR